MLSNFLNSKHNEFSWLCEKINPKIRRPLHNAAPTNFKVLPNLATKKQKRKKLCLKLFCIKRMQKVLPTRRPRVNYLRDKFLYSSKNTVCWPIQMSFSIYLSLIWSQKPTTTMTKKNKPMSFLSLRRCLSYVIKMSYVIACKNTNADVKLKRKRVF